jgi:site-specific recombinase XerD
MDSAAERRGAALLALVVATGSRRSELAGLDRTKRGYWVGRHRDDF